jgi:hypothetical protein
LINGGARSKLPLTAVAVRSPNAVDPERLEIGVGMRL